MICCFYDFQAVDSGEINRNLPVGKGETVTGIPERRRQSPAGRNGWPVTGQLKRKSDSDTAGEGTQ